MTFSTLVGQFLEIINILVFVVFALALLVVVWKLISVWVINAGDANKREEGKKTILIIFIVLVVMSAVWGIVALLGNGLGLANVPIDTTSTSFSIVQDYRNSDVGNGRLISYEAEVKEGSFIA